METNTEQKNGRKRLSGVIVSDKMTNTAVVLVTRYVKHRKYGKFQKLQKRFKAHDEGNAHKMGETVTIEETRPISKDKRFVIVG